MPSILGTVALWPWNVPFGILAHMMEPDLGNLGYAAV
jgi:hypothetical protein